MKTYSYFVQICDFCLLNRSLIRAIQKFKETRDSQHINQNKLNKACFQEDMVYGDFKDLTKTFNISKNPKYERDIKEVLFQWSIHLSIKNFWQY